MSQNGRLMVIAVVVIIGLLLLILLFMASDRARRDAGVSSVNDIAQVRMTPDAAVRAGRSHVIAPRRAEPGSTAG